MQLLNTAHRKATVCNPLQAFTQKYAVCGDTRTNDSKFSTEIRWVQRQEYKTNSKQGTQVVSVVATCFDWKVASCIDFAIFAAQTLFPPLTVHHFLPYFLLLLVWSVKFILDFRFLWQFYFQLDSFTLHFNCCFLELCGGAPPEVLWHSSQFSIKGRQTETQQHGITTNTNWWTR